GDKQDAVGERGDFLVELPGGIAKAATERRLRHEAEPDLVGDQHDGTRTLAQGGAKLCDFRLDAFVCEQQVGQPQGQAIDQQRTEEHTSELQSLAYLVCRLLLEKKN